MFSHTDPTMSSLNVYDPLNPLTTLGKRDPFASSDLGWETSPSRIFNAVENALGTALQPFRYMDFGSSGLTPETRCAQIMKADVLENEKEFRINMNCPGIEASDLCVELKDDSVHIKGHVDDFKEDANDVFIARERHTGDFTRTMRLPVNCDKEKITTTMFNGVLTITVPKLEKSVEAQRVRKLPITEGTGPKAKGAKKGGRGN